MRRWHIVVLAFGVSFAITILVLLGTPHGRDLLAGRATRQDDTGIIRVRLAPRPGAQVVPTPLRPARPADEAPEPTPAVPPALAT
ncbi:hypothetical protein HN371_22365 [Candidatus Poribacteria bacterium]|nr:hypothetical protein [Candidatus Poribacteria bacterium]MBT5536262.1 hypothetical protein [Candidatus Poribacteria bacterium]MBT5712611.1 hypothetical protein [Candidatus Poribacteria bacterium]MBT7099358.1 hypothetical protein [Candidatus Poribacteria bacterium]MBT7807292.1 hypothetical protein [Candidatus Poribacteria bacterium]